MNCNGKLTNNNNDTASNGVVGGFVLARGGSTGIPLKNVQLVNGQPLITWALRAMVAFGKFDAIVVSTDNDEIEKAARSVDDRIKIFRRSPEFAKSDTPSPDSAKEVLLAHPEIDIACMVQCTAPFIRPRKHDYEGNLTPVNYNPYKTVRRQEWPGEIIVNGMFYFFKRDLILKHSSFHGGKVGIVEVPKFLSLDIDDPVDLIVAEGYFKHKQVKEEMEKE